MSQSRLAILLAAALLLTGCATDVSLDELESDTQNGVYEVDGAVLHPGTFHLPHGEVITLAKAIRRSGGPWLGDNYNDGADLDSVHLHRIVSGSEVEYTLDASPGGSDEGFIVRPGDFIQVPLRPFSTPVPIPVPYSS